MNTVPSAKIRNVALIGHGGAGKTTLAEALLVAGGVLSRPGRTEDGTTVCDFEPEEVKRRISVSLALAPFLFEDCKINVIDTPGYADFIAEVEAGLSVADLAVLVVSAVEGVEVQSEETWRLATDLGIPRLVFVNKLDRERSSFERALTSVQEAFGRTAIPVQIPIGAERDFKGVIDLIRMKAYTYTPDGDGKGKESDIPADLADAAQAAHEALVELVAEGNDALMEEFFEKGTLPAEHILDGVQAGTKEMRLFPVLCCSALHNIGTDLILNFVVDNLPAPTERQVTVKTNGEETVRKIADAGPCSAYVFKTTADPFAGRITYFKVYSGVVRNDANLSNQKGTAERLAHIGVPVGKTIVPVTEVHAGDIGAVAKLKDTLTGDTLADKGVAFVYPPVQLLEPSIAFAIEAKSRQDEDRMGRAVHRILEEDQLIRFFRDPQTKEFLLGGSGQQHVEVVASRLKRRYGVEVILRAPKIPYRETIRGHADVQGRHKKQTGGHGQFGVAYLRVEPLERGEGFAFVDAIVGGAIPRQFIPAVEKGVQEAMTMGGHFGYPVVDVRVTCYDGKYHTVDSSEMSFKMAASLGFKEALAAAGPVILEPVSRLEVTVPAAYQGDILGDLNSRRGRVLGTEAGERGEQVVIALVPASEIQRYATDLRSLTGGRGRFVVRHDHHEVVPAPIADRLAKQAAET